LVNLRLHEKVKLYICCYTILLSKDINSMNNFYAHDVTQKKLYKKLTKIIKKI